MALKNIDSYRPPLFQEFPQESLSLDNMEVIREFLTRNHQVRGQILLELQQNPVITGAIDEALQGLEQNLGEAVVVVPPLIDAYLLSFFKGALEESPATQQAILGALGEDPINQQAILEVLQTDPFLDVIAETVESFRQDLVGMFQALQAQLAAHP